MLKRAIRNVTKRKVLRQVGMYETCVILSCEYGRLSYSKWQSTSDDENITYRKLSHLNI